MQVASFSKDEKSRLVDQSNKLKSLSHASLAPVLSVWGNRAQGEIVLISDKAVGEPLSTVDRPTLTRTWRTWAMDLLRVISYLQSNGITPLDLSLSNIYYSESGLVLEDCLFAHDMNEISLALYADEACDSSDELTNSQLLDSVSFGMVLFSVFSQENGLPCLGEVLVQVKDGTIARKVEALRDKRLEEFLKCCLCEKKARLTVQKLMEHRGLRDIDSDEERSSFSQSQSPRSAFSHSREDPESADLSPLLPISLVIELDSGKQVVSFSFDLAKDTEERVAEELLKEFSLGRQYFYQTVDAIRRKVREKDRRSGDLLDLSPKTAPLNSPFEGRRELRRADTYRRMNAEGMDLRLPKVDQSCPSLLDTLPSWMGGGKGVHLKKGAEGTDVKRLQEALKIVLNVELHVDGVYSKKTEQLVKEFQASQDLEVTGVVEPNTWASLTRRFPKLLQSTQTDEHVRSSLRELSKP